MMLVTCKETLQSHNRLILKTHSGWKYSLFRERSRSFQGVEISCRVTLLPKPAISRNFSRFLPFPSTDGVSATSETYLAISLSLGSLGSLRSPYSLNANPHAPATLRCGTVSASMTGPVPELCKIHNGLCKREK